MTATITLPTEIAHTHTAVEMDDNELHALRAAINHAVKLSNTGYRPSTYDEDAGVFVRQDDGELSTMACEIAVRLWADVARSILSSRRHGLLSRFTVEEAMAHVVATGAPHAIGVVAQPEPETDEELDAYVTRVVLIADRLHMQIINALIPFGFDSLTGEHLEVEVRAEDRRRHAEDSMSMASRRMTDEEVTAEVSKLRRERSAHYRALGKRLGVL